VSGGGAADGRDGSTERLRVLLEHGSDVVFTFDDDLRVTQVIGQLQAVIGYPVDVALASPAFDNVLRADRPLLDDALARLRERPGHSEHLRLRARTASGEVRWVEVRITNLADRPEVGEWACTFWDATPDVLAEEEHRRLLEIFDLTSDLVLLIDARGRLRYMNAASRRFFGVDDGQYRNLRGHRWPEHLIVAPEVGQAIVAQGDDFEHWSGEVALPAGDGAFVTTALEILPHRLEDGTIDFYSVVGRDVSERKLLEASLERQATHDPLTGLPNRVLLFDRLASAVNGVRTAGSRHSTALLFVDLDHFKVINDSLGHALGDRLLRSIGGRIRTAVRPGDTVARFGGDEFVVLSERLDYPEDAVRIAARIESTLQEPFRIEGHEIHAGVSIGIAFADPADPDPLSVLRDADTAMYRAKSDGRGRWVLFDDRLRRAAVERQRTEAALRQSRHGDDLALRYQPIVDLEAGRVVALEALLRWQRGGVAVEPEEFVPIAEETGLVVPIGEWVLRTACDQVAVWQRRPGWDSLGLSVNVSARQVQHQGFAATVASALAHSGLRPGSLSLEITESVLLDDVAAARERLEDLRAEGVRIALDDFGTGWSSLTYLQQLPIDVVKLDRSFVSGVGESASETAIVTALVQLAAAMGLPSVAEGVETRSQLDELGRLGCRYGQGFLLSAPLDPDEVPDRLGPDLAALRRAGPAAASLRTAARGGPGSRADRPGA
jgi:diguanylate cyclase (GGDEF)-like protein/PAS domain S-box-containing protein